MSVQLLCDRDTCGELIQDGTERVDVTLPNRQDPVSRQQIPGAGFNFHTTCYQAAGPLLPAAGVSVMVRRVAAVPPPADPGDEQPAAPALPAPLRAPSA
jgi:hypothetical protein